ncbi:ABC transporter substrate-binding protein [Clostridioides difficile]|nr:ABC transporter substrate-binding protein [Clostridioides difficile]
MTKKMNLLRLKILDKVTIAEVTHSVFYAPQYAAITKGFFEDEGIKIDL